jgi:hypothetical protein
VVKCFQAQKTGCPFCLFKAKAMNHETHEIHESLLVKKYRFRVDFFRVVRVFRGKVLLAPMAGCPFYLLKAKRY